MQVRTSGSSPAPSRFQRDVLWNFASLGCLAASGIALNALIGRFYGAAALGAFNQVWAVYIFFSMAAAGGIHLSALRSIAAEGSERSRFPAILAGALVPALVLSAAFAAAFWASRELIADRLHSEAVSLGIEAAAPGLFFFAFNKLLLGVVNGLQRMRAFAVYQSLRYLLLLLGLVVAIYLSVPGSRLPFVLSFSESVLFAVLAIEVSVQIRWWKAERWLPWARTHLSYGFRAVLSGMLLELNSRVDILMLGLFLGDAEVGVYSFAALFAEGFYQLVVVLQNNYNPILARHIQRRELADLESIVKKGRRVTYGLMFCAGAFAVTLYPLAVRLLTNKPEFFSSHSIFAILAAGIVLSSGYLTFQNTLSMAGLPGWHTVFMFSVVAFNVVGNTLLIPPLGTNGAALATAAAFVFSLFLLRWLVRRLVGLRL